MADRVSIAIRQDQALGRITKAAQDFAKKHGRGELVIPTQGNNPDLLRAQQWEALADWFEAEPAAEVPNEDRADTLPDVTAPDYDAMTRAEAVKRAQDAGMPVAKNTTKAEAVDFLMAAAGITEDQQQALDSSASAPAQPENE
jgi:hypothetical protein